MAKGEHRVKSVFTRLFLCFLMAIMVACSKENKPIEIHMSEFNDFELVSNQGDEIKAFLISHDVIHIYVPSDVDMRCLMPVFKKDGIDLKIFSDKFHQDFSDLANPVQYKIVNPSGKESLYTVNIYNLPVLMIDTPEGQPINSKKDRVYNCLVSMVESGCQINEVGVAGIRGRGNWTWRFSPQKPYNIKFDKKVRFSNLNKSKNWILLANGYMDGTHLHNSVAFEMARMTDFPWVPSSFFVELLLNGRHMGLYQLCEKIEVGRKKINIKNEFEQSETFENYLLETKNQPKKNDIYFISDYLNTTGWDSKDSICWEVKYPKEDQLTDVSYSHIKEEINHMESLIADDDSLKIGIYRNYFDIETAINWMLVEEATYNEEAMRSKNIYMYKAKDGKFHIGPPWDFDAWSFGTCHWISSDIMTTSGALYYSRLRKDAIFVERVKEKWSIYRKKWQNEIPKYIDVQAKRIKMSALRNDRMWTDYYEEKKDNDLKNLEWYSPKRWFYNYLHPIKEFDDQVEDMKIEFANRLKYMDCQISSW